VRIRDIVTVNLLLAAVLLAAVLLAVPARAQSTAPPKRVFAGPEGLTVAVVPMQPPATNQVLILVSGSGTVFDAKAIPHRALNVDAGKTNFETTYHGRAWNTLVLRDGAYSLYLPDRREDLWVHFDEKRTAALKADAIYASYQKQMSDGTLQALSAFDRKTEEAQQEKGMQAMVDGFGKACGSKPMVKVDWSSMSDADVQEINVASTCGEPLDAMRRMCEESSEAKAAIAGHVKSFVCAMGKSMKMELAGTTLNWTTGRSATNMGDFTRQVLGKALSLDDRMTLEKTTVCTDGKSHYVVVAPSEKQSRQIYYGDAKTLHRVPLPPWVLTGDSFFEPRFLAKTKNSNFRGLDMRLYASVDTDVDKKTCSVSCGERKTDLQILDAEAKKALLAKAAIEPPLHKRAPHRLARDNNGKYFYVDKGNTPETEKSFRLYVGPKGAMKLQKMTNAVADTEGEIFTTKSGSLRYVTDRQNPPTWIQGTKKTTLTVVPIEAADEKTGEPINNYQLIYNELGVYLGEKLGNPCDDL
jgi:hypothetical protein